MGKIKSIIKLIRVKHYFKNFLIFLPLFFSGNFLTKGIVNVIMAFLSFSFFSSTIYVLNDICDCEKDRKHPVKCKRPIASGAVSEKLAYVIMAICFVLGVAFCIFAKRGVTGFVYPLLYVLVNVVYSIKFKHVPVLDIALLASGFFIRVLYGGAVAGVTVSAWLYLTITAISFYMVLGKRKKELDKHNDKNTRAVLKAYTSDFLDKFMYVSLTLAVVFYSLWAKDFANEIMIWTVPFIILIAMKYSLAVNTPDSDGDPIEVLLGSRSLIVMIAVYAVVVALAIYFPDLFSVFKM